MKCGDSGGRKSNGEPCKREVHPGFTRCTLHGGANLTAKIKAETMLAVARIPSIEALHYIIDQFLADECPTCGFPKGDAEEKRVIVQTAKTILDRTGMGPHSTIELTKQTDGDVNLQLMTDQEKVMLLGWLAQIKALKDSLRSRQTGQGQVTH